MTGWLGLALAARADDGARVDVHVVAPDGTVAWHDTVPLPASRTFGAGGRGFGVYVASFDGPRAIVELAAGPIRKGRPLPREAVDDELDPGVPWGAAVTRRGETWQVALRLHPPDPAPAAPQ